MPSVADGSTIADSNVIFKEQGDNKKVSIDGSEKNFHEPEGTADASLRSPVTPAPVSESDGTPALRQKSLKSSDPFEDKRLTDGKDKLVINLCRIPRSLMKVSEVKGGHPEQTMASVEASHVGKTGTSLLQSGPAHQKSNRNSAYISEFAKKVRLRVKRVKRHVKPNVYQRRNAASDAKVKVFEAKCPVVKDVCKVAPDVAQETCDKSHDEDPAVGRNGSQVPGMCDEVLDNEFALVEQGSHVLQEPLPAENDLLKPSDVVVSEERGRTDCMEDGEIDASQDADCCIVSGNTAFEGSSEPLPRDSVLATNSSGPAHKPESNLTGKECSMDQTTVLREPLRKVAAKEGVLKGGAKGLADCSGAEALISDNRPRIHRDRELTSRDSSRRDYREHSARGRGPSKARSLSGSLWDGAALSDTSKLDLKEHTILETLLPDELPGFSFDGGSDGGSDHRSGRHNDGIHNRELERGANSDHSQTEESESDEAGSSEGSEYSASESSRSQEAGGVRNGPPVKCLSPGTPGRGAQFTDQVPSVLCDAEGNVWHIGKRAEQAREVEDVQPPGPPKARFKERRSVALDRVRQGHEPHESVANQELPAVGCAPFNHLLQLRWKWPSHADSNSDLPTNRIVVAKERSIFVGCIPDGVENLEQLLNGLMDRFLERFDFAPVTFGQIEVVKAVKDFAFIELTSEKVAQIVLAANQLDVFEWGVNGYHFNIQGCTATYTSVRPLIEYLPLRPARVLYVGNIPKSRWRKDYLEAFFSKMLRGSDGPTDLKYVVSVFLLPDSSDAYVEVASEIMADALIFKCTKSPELLKDIGEDVLICRDASSVPLMSRHKGSICPQRSLFIAVPPRGEDFKINSVVKVFVDLLPFIARKSNCPGYLEFVLVEPGKEHAFFQFSSEAFVDAIMDEYIESTQIFLCRGSPASYIILRPPEYVRPGARYRSGSLCRGLSGTNYKLPIAHAYGSDMVGRRQARNSGTQQSMSIAYVPRRFGDEPAKKPDCIVSLGASPAPLTTWNGLSSSGSCSADPGCMIVVEGLPKGLSFKLARGALNELFERLLLDSGLLEVGMLVVRYLDRDGKLDVASLPNAEFVCAILSVESTFVVAGEEIRLLPYDRKGLQWRSNSADLSGGPCELSSLSDEDSQGRTVIGNYAADGWSAPSFQQQRKRGLPELEGRFLPGFDTGLRSSAIRRNNLDGSTDEWGQGKGWTGSLNTKQGSRGFPQESVQMWHGASDQHRKWDGPCRSGSQGTRPLEDLHCQGNNPNPRVRIPHAQKGTVTYRNESRTDEAGSRLEQRSEEEGLRIVSREGKRTIQQVGGLYVHEAGGPVGMGGLSVKKRKFPAAGSGGPVHTVGFSQKMRRNSQFTL
eukprot:c14636_g1_i1 orf=243-4331(+)